LQDNDLKKGTKSRDHLARGEKIMQKEAAVIIIGGGIFGCSTAYHLAKRGQRDVVILEKNAIASGTTPMAAGLVPQIRSTELLTRALTYSIEFFKRFAEETGCSAGFQQVGSLKLALTDDRIKEMEDNIALGKQLGIEIDFITPEHAKTLLPILDSTGVKAITFAPRDGFVNPYLAAVGLATGAHRLGVKIYTHTRVNRIEPGIHGEHRVITEKGELRTPVIVDAAGAWAKLLGEGLGLWIPVTAMRHQYCITAPLDGVHPEQPVLRIPDLNGYCRQEQGGLLVGGYEAHPQSFDLNTLPSTFEIPHVPGDFSILQHFLQEMQRYLPLLSAAFIVRENRGLPTLTPDGNFLIGDIPEIPGFYIATGCCVTGISAAPVLGKLLAELIVDGKSSLDIHTMHINRFGPEYRDPERLRKACEDVYAHYYALGWGKI
jgi:4-methylaminobutanoate oxidase (formaldehyde-forming)